MAKKRYKDRLPFMKRGEDGLYRLVLAGKKEPHLCRTSRCRNHRPHKRGHCDACRKRLERANNPVRAAWAHIRDRAKKKNLPFDLDFEWFKDWAEKSKYINNKGVTSYALHIDRRIRSLGYVKTNVQVLTCRDNVAKGNRERHEIEEPNPF